MNLAFFANGPQYVMEGELLAKSVLYHMPAAKVRWYFVDASQMEVRRMKLAGVIPCPIPMPDFLAEFLDGYWLGMKAVACAAAAADFGAPFWFTDSDTICYGPINHGPEGKIQAELIGDIGFLRYGSWMDDDAHRAAPWREAERLFCYAPMMMPAKRTYSGFREGRPARLANNSGVIWIGEPIFGERWVDTLQQLIESKIFVPHQYFQEQWSFSVTLARFHFQVCHPGPEHPGIVRPSIFHYAGFKPATLLELRSYILGIGDNRRLPLLETFDAVVGRSWSARAMSLVEKSLVKARNGVVRIKNLLAGMLRE